MWDDGTEAVPAVGELPNSWKLFYDTALYLSALNLEQDIDRCLMCMQVGIVTCHTTLQMHGIQTTSRQLQMQASQAALKCGVTHRLYIQYTSQGTNALKTLVQNEQGNMRHSDIREYKGSHSPRCSRTSGCCKACQGRLNSVYIKHSA